MSERYHVKCRKKGSKRYAFISTGGSINHLRIHASVFASKAWAEDFVKLNAPDNPGWEFLVAPERR